MVAAMRRTLFALFALAALCGAAYADVKPHSLFTDGAVLQRERPLPVWGTARDGEKVTVRVAGQTAVTTAQDGQWRVWLKPLKAGGPFTMTIQGDNTVEVKNVLVGEVWVCSGQSNMEWPLSLASNAQEAIANSADPMLRLFTVPKRVALAPERDINAVWQECNPQTVPGFTAVGYFFGRNLRRALNVPVGLIHTSWGGTPAESWTSQPALEADPQLRYLAENRYRMMDAYPQQLAQYQTALLNYPAAAAAAKRDGKEPPRPPARPQPPTSNPWLPSSLYNGMIAPLLPYPIRGAIWYQGESNAGRAWEYRNLFTTMIRDWRRAWNDPDQTFLLVQLAPFTKIERQPTESAWAELREAQLYATQVLPKVGMAVITDVGEENDIHPRRKEPVGARLALAARALAYGEKIEYSGPVYRSMKVDENRVVLRFRHVDGGLVAKGGALTGFTICGENRRFVNAQAEIKGNTVVVYSLDVIAPVAVRFGWANYPVVNLYNMEGLPATPFRTDDFPLTTKPK
jgi:sialate O-acetylesterase